MKHLLVIAAAFMLVACESELKGGNSLSSKDCRDCVATDFPGGPNRFNETMCVARANCRNGNEQILNAASQDKCGSLNRRECTGRCPGEYQCEGILNPDSDWRDLFALAQRVPGRCPAGQVMCKVTVVIPANERMDCKCSCNPDG